MSDNLMNLELELQQIYMLASDANGSNYKTTCEKICRKILKIFGMEQKG